MAADDVRLYLGDCLELMKQIPSGSVDAVVTDPPYGINASTGWSRELYGTIGALWDGGSIRNDKDYSMRDYIIDWARQNNKPLAVFGSATASEPAGYITRLIWDKGEAAGMGDLSIPWKPNYDFIHVYGRAWAGPRNSSVLRAPNIPRISMGRVHPHEKPIGLLKQIIEKLPEGITILDPFMGSGSTGVACIQSGRKFIGIEIDKRYYEIACKRIEQAQAQMRLPV